MVFTPLPCTREPQRPLSAGPSAAAAGAPPVIKLQPRPAPPGPATHGFAAAGAAGQASAVPSNFVEISALELGQVPDRCVFGHSREAFVHPLPLRSDRQDRLSGTSIHGAAQPAEPTVGSRSEPTPG